jgi:DNA-binding NarL/FixJ family response regulator
MDTIRVLLADDHAILRDGLRSLLSLHGDMEVVAEAEHGAQAVEHVRRYSPDVVVMDIAMPQMNGLEAIRRITAERSRTRILVLSQHDDERYVLPCCQAGAAGYLLKSAAADELVYAIRTVARGGSYLPPDIAERVLRAFRSLAQTQPPLGEPFLSDREREVLTLVAEGCTSKEIAERLVLSQKTVMCHRANINQKLGARSRAELIRWAAQNGLLNLAPPPSHS